jgi:integrase
VTRAAKGDGSLFKTADGAYRGYVTVNGKRKYFSAKTKAEAGQKRRDLLNRREQGALVAGRSPTVEAWTRHWLENIAKHRPTTYATNRWIVEERIVKHLGTIPISNLTAERIEQWIADLGVKPASARRYLAPLRRALNVAVDRGRIPFNPAERVSLEPQRRRTPEVLSGDDRAALLAAATGYNSARWHLALRLGLRPGEVLGLTWHNFDEKAGTLTVTHQLLYAKGRGVYHQPEPKTDAGDRIIYLPRTLVAALAEQRRLQLALIAEAGDEWVGWEQDGQPVALIFTQENGLPIGTRTDTAAWQRLLDIAGLPKTRRYTMRHTAASHLVLESGGDVATVADTLGHADPGFTYRTYVHPLLEQKRALAGRLDGAPYPAPYEADIEPHQATQAEVAPQQSQG